MAFVLDWRKKLGYREDPFVPEPSKRVHDFFVDREQERETINLFIIKRTRYGILQGAKGVGRTALLRWTAEELEQRGMKGDVFLLDDEKALGERKRLADALLDRTLSMLERKVMKPQEKLGPAEREELLLKKLAKRHVLILIDDAGALSKDALDLLKRILETCPGTQLILSLERVLKVHEELGGDGLGLALDDLSDEALTALVAKRMALAGAVGTFPFEEADLKKLVAASKRSPVKLLGLCRERAIELSLKVDGPPKPQPAQPAAKASAARPSSSPSTQSSIPQPAPQEPEDEDAAPAKGSKMVRFEEQPKKKLFSIRFVREEDLKAERARAAMKERQDEPSGDALLDAGLLGDIVDTAEAKKAAPATKRPERRAEPAEDVDAVIQSLVEELEEPDAKSKTKRR